MNKDVMEKLVLPLTLEALGKITLHHETLSLCDRQVLSTFICEYVVSRVKATFEQKAVQEGMLAHLRSEGQKNPAQMVQLSVDMMLDGTKLYCESVAEKLWLENVKTFLQDLANPDESTVLNLFKTYPELAVKFQLKSGDNLLWLLLTHNKDLLNTLLNDNSGLLHAQDKSNQNMYQRVDTDEYESAHVTHYGDSAVEQKKIKLPDINEPHPVHGRTLLMHAATMSVELTKLFLNNGALLRIKTSKRRCNILHAAAKNPEVLRYLFSKNCADDFPALSQTLPQLTHESTYDGIMPLFNVAVADDVDSCRLLLKNNASLKSSNKKTAWNIFHSCSKYNARKMVEWLFSDAEDGFKQQFEGIPLPDIDASGFNCPTPLFFAIQEDNIGMLKLLLKHGASLTDELFLKAMIKPKISKWVQSAGFKKAYPRLVKEDPLTFYLEQKLGGYCQSLTSDTACLNLSDVTSELTKHVLWQRSENYGMVLWDILQIMTADDREYFRVAAPDGTHQSEKSLQHRKIEDKGKIAAMPYHVIPYLQGTDYNTLADKCVSDHVQLIKLWPALNLTKEVVAKKALEIWNAPRKTIKASYADRVTLKNYEKIRFHHDPKKNEAIKKVLVIKKDDNAIYDITQNFTPTDMMDLFDLLIDAYQENRLESLAEPLYILSQTRGLVVWNLYQLCAEDTATLLEVKAKTYSTPP